MTNTMSPRCRERQALDADAARASAMTCNSTTQKRPTKQDLVVTLLQVEGGVPLSAIVDATGWLPHTVRAALTSLRKKGHTVTRTKVDGEIRYSDAAVVSE